MMESGESEIIEEPSTPGIVAQIGTALASQATVFLLTFSQREADGIRGITVREER